MIGQGYSTSPNCGVARLIGGPYDGETGLFDMPLGVTFSLYSEQCNYTYLPERPGSWTWIFKGTEYWNHGSQLAGDPINGWRRRCP